MDSNTLNLYTVAAGLSLCLCLVMAIFSYFQAGTPLVRKFVIGLLVMTAGFFLAGIGPLLPTWIRVIVGNMLLIAAGPFMYAGVTAYCFAGRQRPDYWGWAIVAVTAPAFWYWGLIDPNGTYRSAVFSLAVALINVRTADVLLRAAIGKRGGIPTWALAALFCVAVAWMSLRCIHLLSAPEQTPEIRAANPTHWTTVFGYIVLASLIAVSVMWMEVNRTRNPPRPEMPVASPLRGFFEYFRNKLLLFWSAVVVINLAIIGALAISYVNFHGYEMTRLTQSTETINDAFAKHTQQVIKQVETLLNGVNAFYLRTNSIPETEVFIRNLGFDTSIIDNIYLLSADGRAVISHDPATQYRSVADREYFRFHQANSDPAIRFSPVEPGRVTGLSYFRITQRVNLPDGSFGGIVLANVRSESFTRYFRDLLGHEDNLAALADTDTRNLIASVPAIDPSKWPTDAGAPLWLALKNRPAGKLAGPGLVDGLDGLLIYKKIPDMPLVVMTGFSNATLAQSVNERLSHVTLITGTIVAFALMLGFLFTLEAKRRDEQDRFMSMLSHELKTPMSVITMTLGAGNIPVSVKDRVARSIADMNLIIERCLQSDRLRFGRIRWAPEPCQLAAILSEIRQASAEPGRIIIETQDLPSCTTDEQLVRMILSNLIDNALKYGATDKPVVVQAMPQKRKKQSGILIDVVNSIGTAGAPDPKRVFGKYYRGERARGKSGSGLGLHIAAGFAAKIGGAVHYHATDTEISFQLWIPG